MGIQNGRTHTRTHERTRKTLFHEQHASRKNGAQSRVAPRLKLSLIREHSRDETRSQGAHGRVDTS